MPEAMDMARTTEGWSLLPLVLLRSTGFAFELLDGLHTPRTADACGMVAAHERERGRAAIRFHDEVFPATLAREQAADAERRIFKAWYRIRRSLSRGVAWPPEIGVRVRGRVPQADDWFDEWEFVNARADDAWEHLHRTWAEELRPTRAHLRHVATGARFREAVLLSSPSMYAGLRRWLDKPPEPYSGQQRRFELRLYGYLQRFCAKNDTTSFFGPVDYARVDIAATTGLDLRRTPGTAPARRLTRMAYWAAQALADAVAADRQVRPYLRPRLRPDCARTDGDTVAVTARQRHVRLHPHQARAVTLADGSRTVDELRATRDLDWAIDDLLKRGLLTTGMEIPTAELDPLSWVRAQVTALPSTCPTRTRWCERIDRLAARVARFPAVPVDDKPSALAGIERDFTGICDVAPRRGGGTLFADRMLVHDDARGDVAGCTIGGPLAEALRAHLAPALDLCASYSAVVQQVCRERAVDLLRRRGGGGPVPYLAFAAALQAEAPVAECVTDPRVTTWLSCLAEIVEQHRDDDCARLSGPQLQRLLCPVAPGTVVSPDVFLPPEVLGGDFTGGPLADLRPVIGEIHYGAQTWTHLLALCDQREAHAGVYGRMLSTGGDRWSMVHRRTQGKAFPLEVPGGSIEVGGRSIAPREQVLPVADIEVVADDGGRGGDGGVALWSRSLRRRVDLHPNDPRATVNWLSATPPVVQPPLPARPQRPRVEVDGVVLWRAAWELDGNDMEALGDRQGAAAMAGLHGLAADRGLPRRCYVRLPDERKPCYLDLDSALSVEHLMLRSDGAAGMQLTEALPDPAAWGLPEPDGTRGCEWRMTWVWQGDR